jgi:hypothetical protein
MNIDWTKATVKVTVPIQHTATTDTQEVDVPVEQFAAWIFDAYSKQVRSEFARKAVARREESAVAPPQEPLPSGVQQVEWVTCQQCGAKHLCTPAPPQEHNP